MLNQLRYLKNNMAIEIERKFLLINDSWRKHADSGTKYEQGYLIGGEAASVRVRIEGEMAFLNIKSATLGIRRTEYEYPIPHSEAKELLLTLCEKPTVRKTRYHVQVNRHTWEIDVFEGENKGLVVAEIELENETDTFDCPDWLGVEVSNDPRYYNVNLGKYPYTKWTVA